MKRRHVELPAGRRLGLVLANQRGVLPVAPPPIVKYVAVGTVGGAGITAWSFDGVTWTAGTGFPAALHAQSIVSNGQVWIAAGGNNASDLNTIGAISTDGKAWTQFAFPSNSYRWGLLWAGGKNFYATHPNPDGSGNYVITKSADNGATWNDLVLTNFVFSSGPFSLGYNGSRILVPASGPDAWFSDDQFTTKTQLSNKPTLDTNDQGVAPWSGHVWALGNFAGSGAVIATPGASITWASINTTNHGAMNHVAFGNGVFSALRQAFYTIDAAGTTLTFQGTLSAIYNDLIFDGAKFMAVGTGGLIATSTDGLAFSEATVIPGATTVWNGIAVNPTLV